jgi:RES domain-containing protein
MQAYRIVSERYANDLSGTGAAIHGGRWNRRGVPVLYAGESREIALLEWLVNASADMVPKLKMVTISFPDDSVWEMPVSSLPENWNEYPAPKALAFLGDEWIRSERSLVMKVPSCILPSSSNFVINCRHKDFGLLKLENIADFAPDKRFLRKE